MIALYLAAVALVVSAVFIPFAVAEIRDRIERRKYAEYYLEEERIDAVDRDNERFRLEKVLFLKKLIDEKCENMRYIPREKCAKEYEKLEDLRNEYQANLKEYEFRKHEIRNMHLRNEAKNHGDKNDRHI